MFSTVAVPFYIPTGMNDCSGLHYILPTLVFFFPFFCLFDYGQTSVYEVVAHYAFDLHFPNGNINI